MSIKVMEAPELLSLNKFNVNEKEAHIVINKEICAQCQDKPCLIVCPAALYKLDAGCLECGTCRVVCKNKGIIKWEYPKGTFGVNFRYG
jgi:ferredoxin like protein